MKKIPVNDLQALLPEYGTISEIAAGGFKTVYRTTNANGDLEALKVISIPNIPGAPGVDEFREECIGRVRREVAILDECSSPFLVKTAGVALAETSFAGDDFVYYSEEFLEGSNLWDLILAQGAKPGEQELKELMRCMLLAIRDLKDLQMVHRDIKPLNIIKTVYRDRPFVLIDLGIAFSLQETALTYNAENRAPLATYRYISPEQCDPRNRANLDHRSDLYSLALTVFEYAAHVHPVAKDQDDFLRTVTRALKAPPKKLYDLRPDLSVEFCELIDQLLKKRPALRPGNLNRLIKMMETA